MAVFNILRICFLLVIMAVCLVFCLSEDPHVVLVANIVICGCFYKIVDVAENIAKDKNKNESMYE